MLGRPPRPRPDDFEEVFEVMGWECADHYGTNPRKIAQWADQTGRERLRTRRRNYVLGNRLSSLKVGKSRVYLDGQDDRPASQSLGQAAAIR